MKSINILITLIVVILLLIGGSQLFESMSNFSDSTAKETLARSELQAAIDNGKIGVIQANSNAEHSRVMDNILMQQASIQSRRDFITDMTVVSKSQLPFINVIIIIMIAIITGAIIYLNKNMYQLAQLTSSEYRNKINRENGYYIENEPYIDGLEILSGKIQDDNKITVYNKRNR